MQNFEPLNDRLKPGEAFISLDDYDAGIRQLVPYYDLMQDIICRTIPDSSKTILELGSGTGELTMKILKNHPHERLICLDYSSRMIQFMTNKLKMSSVGGHVEGIVGDFRHLDSLEGTMIPKGSLDACVSMLAVHHLDYAEKLDLIESVYQLLRPGGSFWIADILQPSVQAMAHHYSMAREQWLTNQNLTREIVLKRMIVKEPTDETYHDKPETLQMNLKLFQEVGFTTVDVLWKYFGTGVFGGIK